MEMAEIGKVIVYSIMAIAMTSGMILMAFENRRASKLIAESAKYNHKRNYQC